MPCTTGTPPFDSKEVQSSPLTVAGDHVRLLADTRFTRKLTAVHNHSRWDYRALTLDALGIALHADERHRAAARAQIAHRVVVRVFQLTRVQRRAGALQVGRCCINT